MKPIDNMHNEPKYHPPGSEPLSNMGFVCKEHAAKPDPQYFDKPLEWFLGKYVMLSFVTGLQTPLMEHMWVKVMEIKQMEGAELIGLVANDPYYVTDYKCGDGVGFMRTEIERVE